MIKFTYSYTIKLKQYENPPCPNQCNHQRFWGHCDQTGVCDCSSERIDEDCSNHAVILYKNQNQLFNHQYTSNSDKDVKITINNPSPTSLSIYLQIEGASHSLVPNKLDYFSLHQMSNQKSTLTIESRYIRSQDGNRKIIMGLIQEDVISLEVEIKIQDSEESKDDEEDHIQLVMIFVYIIIGCIAFTAVIILIVKLRQKYIPPPDEINQLDQIQSQPRQHRKKKEKRTLTPDIVDKYMPPQYFVDVLEDIKESDCAIQNDCSVCLEKFVPTSQVRVTICAHIFHKNCLEEWLIKQESCPFCRSGLNNTDLKTWKKNRIAQIKELLKQQNIMASTQQDFSEKPQKRKHKRDKGGDLSSNVSQRQFLSQNDPNINMSLSLTNVQRQDESYAMNVQEISFSKEEMVQSRKIKDIEDIPQGEKILANYTEQQEDEEINLTDKKRKLLQLDDHQTIQVNSRQSKRSNLDLQEMELIKQSVEIQSIE